jgi:hypothetical protein
LNLNSWIIFQRFNGNPKNIITRKLKNPNTKQKSNMGREKYGTSPMGIFPYMRYACRRVRRRDIYHPIIKTQVMTIRTFSITRRVLFIEKRDLYYLLLHAVADHCAKSVKHHDQQTTLQK